MAQSTIEGGRTRSAQKQRGYFEVTTRAPAKPNKWNAPPARAPDTRRPPHQLKIDQGRLDQGQGGWFQESRRHHDAALKGQDRRERHSPVRTEQQPSPWVLKQQAEGLKSGKEEAAMIRSTGLGMRVGWGEIRTQEDLLEYIQNIESQAKGDNTEIYHLARTKALRELLKDLPVKVPGPAPVEVPELKPGEKRIGRWTVKDISEDGNGKVLDYHGARIEYRTDKKVRMEEGWLPPEFQGKYVGSPLNMNVEMALARIDQVRAGDYHRPSVPEILKELPALPPGKDFWMIVRKDGTKFDHIETNVDPDSALQDLRTARLAYPESEIYAMPMASKEPATEAYKRIRNGEAKDLRPSSSILDYGREMADMKYADGTKVQDTEAWQRRWSGRSYGLPEKNRHDDYFVFDVDDRTKTFTSRGGFNDPAEASRVRDEVGKTGHAVVMVSGREKYAEMDLKRILRDAAKQRSQIAPNRVKALEGF